MFIKNKIIPQKLKMSKLLKATSKIAAKRGITLEEMLAELDIVKKDYEKHGGKTLGEMKKKYNP